MEIDLKENLDQIISFLEGEGMMTTKIANAIGYTSTRQLYNTLDGTSMISTKAVRALIVNLNVNPVFLFLGKGDMFLSEESEIETLRRENQEWIQRHSEALKNITALTEIINKLEKKNDDLIEISSAAIKYYKGQNEGDIGEKVVLEEKDSAPIISNKPDLKEFSVINLNQSYGGNKRIVIEKITESKRKRPTTNTKSDNESQNQ